MKTKNPTTAETIDACYQLAGKLDSMAGEACDQRDTSRVHWLVTESRRVANLARTIERRSAE